MGQVDLMVRTGEGSVFCAALLDDSDLQSGVKYFWAASKKGSQPYEVQEENCDKLFNNLQEALECVEGVCSPYPTDYLGFKSPEDWADSEVPAYRKWAAAQQGLSLKALLRMEVDPVFEVRHEAQKALGYCSTQNPYRAPRNYAV